MKRPTPLLSAICSSGFSGSLCFKLTDVSDVDPPGLHPVRHAPDQIDMQKPVFERGALDLDIIGEVKAPFEGARRDTLVQVLGLVLFRASCRLR